MDDSNTPTIDLFSPSDPRLAARHLRNRVRRWRMTLRRFWWVLPLITLPLAGGTWYYSSKIPSKFESTGKMWVTGRMNLNEGKVYTEDLGNFIGTQAELLRSKTVQQRALNEVIDQFPEYAGLTNFPFELEVKDSAKSSVLELRAVGDEPRATRIFLASVMQQYLAFKRETREQASGKTLESATAQIRALEDALNREQSKMYAFQRSNNVVFLKEQDNSAGTFLAGINRQLASLRSEYQLLEMIQPDQFIAIANGSAVPADEKRDGESDLAVTMATLQADHLKASQQLHLLKARQTELARFLRPAHPKMIKLNEDIATQELLIENFRRESATQLANRKEAIRLQIKNLEAVAAEWDVKAVEASRKITELDQIRQNVAQLQASHERMMGIVQSVDLGKNIGQENVGVMEPASEAEALDVRWRNLAIALVASLIVGFASLYLIAIFDDRFASAVELTNHLDEPVIGEVPKLGIGRARKPVQLERVNRRHLPFLEAFRNIRSSLLYFGDGAERPKSIVVTSAIPEEGKSTVAAYLGTMLAIGGARVLLVDADLRQGALHEFFDQQSGPGLAEVLEGECKLDDAIVDTAIPNLRLLPCGKARCHPGELFLSARMDSLVKEVTSEFDYVLVDSSPVLAADDTTTLAPKLDCALFVVRAVFTPGRITEQGLALLRQRGVNVLGLIFNRAQFSGEGHHSYERYHGYYRHSDTILPMKRQPA